MLITVGFFKHVTHLLSLFRFIFALITSCNSGHPNAKIDQSKKFNKITRARPPLTQLKRPITPSSPNYALIILTILLLYFRFSNIFYLDLKNGYFQSFINYSFKFQFLEKVSSFQFVHKVGPASGPDVTYILEQNDVLFFIQSVIIIHFIVRSAK